MMVIYPFHGVSGPFETEHCVPGWQCDAPDPGPTRMADPNRFLGRETQDWDSLPDFVFFKTDLIPVGMAHILKQNPNIIYKSKNYHRSGVHQNLDTYN